MDFFPIFIFAIVEKVASALSLVINSIVTVLEDRDFILGFILLTVEKEMLQCSGYWGSPVTQTLIVIKNNWKLMIGRSSACQQLLFWGKHKDDIEKSYGHYLVNLVYSC